MGMEGKLRRISEFELAAYRKNPAKLYSDLFSSPPTSLGEFSKLTAKIQDIQQSEVGKRIRERAMSGQAISPEDSEALKAAMSEVFSGVPGLPEAMEDHLPGLSKDKKRLSLHKSWSVLNFLLTGKSMEPGDSPIAQAILGGTEIPDVNKVMGYGPVRYLLPADVHRVSQVLDDFPIQQKAAEYDPERAEAAKVYLPHHSAEELTEYFEALREFYSLAARNIEAVLLWIE